MKLYFIHVPGCSHCEAAKPHIRKFARSNPQVQVVPIDLTTANWEQVAPPALRSWQPDVTPTYVLEIPRQRHTQHQGMLTEREIPLFIEKSKSMLGITR